MGNKLTTVVHVDVLTVQLSPFHKVATSLATLLTVVRGLSLDYPLITKGSLAISSALSPPADTACCMMKMTEAVCNSIHMQDSPSDTDGGCNQ